MQIHAITFLWGETYTKTFLETVLPSLLSRGNLGGTLPDRWRFFTTEADWRTVADHALFPQIEPTVLRTYEHFAKVGSVETGYYGMWSLYQMAVREAWDAEAALLFLPPDTVMADGTLRNALSRLRRGWRAVVLPRPRVIKETFEQAAHERIAAEGALSSRWLAATAAGALHPLTRQSFRDAPEFTTWPANIIERDGVDLAIRAYHVPPLIVHPRRHAADFENIDLDFTGLAVPAWQEIYVPASSDEMAQVDLTDTRQCDFLLGSSPMNAGAVEAWVREEDRGGYNRWLFTHVYRLREAARLMAPPARSPAAA